jgi:hypothetical protein
LIPQLSLFWDDNARAVSVARYKSRIPFQIGGESNRSRFGNRRRHQRANRRVNLLELPACPGIQRCDRFLERLQLAGELRVRREYFPQLTDISTARGLFKTIAAMIAPCSV